MDDDSIQISNPAQKSYAFKQVVGSRESKVRAFLPDERSILKLEFVNTITDKSYFYLISTIRLTEAELCSLFEHLEKAPESAFASDLVKNKKRKRNPIEDISDEEYKESSTLSSASRKR